MPGSPNSDSSGEESSNSHGCEDCTRKDESQSKKSVGAVRKQKACVSTLNEQVSDTAFIRNLKSSLKNNESLRVNRRGLVDLNDSGEKPVFSADELYRNRRLGLSFKAISKKLGIDKSKEELLQVSRVLQAGCKDCLPSIDAVDIPYRRSLPTPLWYLWDSELDIIGKSALPSQVDLMAQSPHFRVLQHLGTDAGWMLQTLLDVQQVVHQEVLNSFEYTLQDSTLGQVELWTNHLPSTLIRQAIVLERRVSEAAFQMTPSYQEGNGRCRCGGVKSLKFKWKQNPLDHPSFF